ncbi:hypothetical protein Tco_0223750 [Tanacetum coccineum]
MAKGQPKKKKKAKKDLFTIYFHYDGIFICSPLEYTQGHMKELNDTNFHDMSYEHLKEIALRLVPHGCFEKLYYCQTDVKLNLGLTELRSNQDIGDMLKVGYENGNAIDMYVEHFGYDIMEMAQADRNEEQNQNSIESSDDDYNSSDCEEIENVDFQTEGDESVVIKDISTSDPFLNKLCSARIMFRGTTEHIQTEIPLVDPDENQIDAVNKTPQQLKLALANYGVANGYRLWYMKNDWKEVLVYCGRNVEEGRCAGKKGNNNRVMPNKVKSGVKKKVVKKQTVKKTTVLDSGEGTSQSTKWTKKQIQDSKKVVCPFRLKMRDDIIQKFMIDVSLGQCTRAKQLALFDNEGGLIEHYGKLYHYRQTLLESNLGSICRLDVDQSANGSVTFRRIYICFKGVKDGWLAGCRKVATSCTLEQQFVQIMDQIKQLDEGAYDYLIQRNPNSWSMAFFEMDRRCAAFENEISKSFNRAILIPRHKPIITMLEEIRLYIMQRLAAMNKVAFSLEDRITPSIRKRLEILKEKQREWTVFPSGFQELEIRKGDHSLEFWVKDTTDVTFEDIGEAPAMTISETTDVAKASMLEESPMDKGKGKESPVDEASRTKRKRGRPPSHVNGRIYHKNLRKSERIANMKLKKPFQFDKHGTGNTPEKAFDVDD